MNGYNQMDEIVIGDMVYTPKSSYYTTINKFREMKQTRGILLSKIQDAEDELINLQRQIRAKRAIEQRKQSKEHKRLMLEELLKKQSRKYKID